MNLVLPIHRFVSKRQLPPSLEQRIACVSVIRGRLWEIFGTVDHLFNSISFLSEASEMYKRFMYNYYP